MGISVVGADNAVCPGIVERMIAVIRVLDAAHNNLTEVARVVAGDDPVPTADEDQEPAGLMPALIDIERRAKELRDQMVKFKEGF